MRKMLNRIGNCYGALLQKKLCCGVVGFFFQTARFCTVQKERTQLRQKQNTRVLSNLGKVLDSAFQPLSQMNGRSVSFVVHAPDASEFDACGKMFSCRTKCKQPQGISNKCQCQVWVCVSAKIQDSRTGVSRHTRAKKKQHKVTGILCAFAVSLRVFEVPESKVNTTDSAVNTHV